MAGYGMYDFRDPSLEDYINFEHELDVIQKKGGTKQEFKVLFQACNMPSGATMIAADSGRTNEFDGTGTPIIIYAISSDNTEDLAAGDGALEVTVFGTDENDAYIEETIVLNGTTQVAGTQKFKRLIAAKLNLCGVDGVGTGNVTISNTGQTETYLTIPAGQIGSAQAGKVYIPDGWKAMILALFPYFIQLPDANSLKLTEGANVWIRFFGGNLIPDELHQISVYANNSPRLIPHFGVVDGGDDNLFDIYHQSIDTDTVDHFVHYDLYCLLWKEA